MSEFTPQFQKAAERAALVDKLVGALGQYSFKEAKTLLSAHPLIIDAHDTRGLTPLVNAILTRSEAAIDFLLEHGADTVEVRSKGMNAVNWALHSRYPFSLAEKLIDASLKKESPAARPAR